jgi:stage III sporulation protein AG
MENKQKIKEFLLQVGPLRLVLVGICGVFLVLTTLPKNGGSSWLKTTTTSDSAKEEGKETETGSISQESQSEVTNENIRYTTQMEEKLKEILENGKGIGKVEVMITLAASRETVLNKDTPYEETVEEQEGNEKKTSQTKSRQEETVLIETEEGQTPYVTKQYEPEIEGILVVVEGGGNPNVEAEVKEAILALFPIEEHKIKVLEMEDET